MKRVLSRSWIFATLKENVEAFIESGQLAEVAVASALTPLMDAIISENVDLVKALLETGASIEADPEDTNSVPSLYQAIYGGDVEMVETLIDAGASRSSICGQTGFSFPRRCFKICDIDRRVIQYYLRPLILLIEAPKRAAKHPGVLHRGCLAVGHI